MSRRVWTDREDAVLREMYPEHFACEIGELLGRCVLSVYNRAHLLGLKSSREKLVRAGRMSSNNPNVIAAQFRKGSVPANKGKKMSAEVYEKAAPTMFKEGHRPHNTASVGDEAIRKGGYIYVKIAEPNVWRAKHIMLWESVNGKIPKGYNIQFKNRDVTDIRIENLYMISRSEQLKKENSLMARYPEELQQVIRLKGVLRRHINKHNRKQQ